ncbi:MAG: prepilin peptidase [Hyphomicrobium sp.]
MFEYPLLFVFPLAMAYAAASDLLTMTIPNRISLMLFASFLVLGPLSGMNLQAMGVHLGIGAAVLACGVALFALGYFGGGDAKLLAAASLWFGLDQIGPFLGNVAIIGGILCVVILLYRQVPTGYFALPEWAERLHSPKSGVPYGIAISIAALMVYPQTKLYLAFAT